VFANVLDKFERTKLWGNTETTVHGVVRSLRFECGQGIDDGIFKALQGEG
jgi:hypothetical protein